MIGLAGLGYSVFRANLNALDELNQENLDWSTNRLLNELVQFQRELVQLEAGQPGTSPTTVTRRFDILWSRLAQAEQGEFGERLQAYDHEQTLKRLFKAVRDAEADVTGLRSGDVATLRRLSQTFLPFEQAVVGFNRVVFIEEERRVANVRADINRSAQITALATIAAFLTTGLALYLVNRERRVHREMAEDNLLLARAAEQANKAKSRFLTMMSHELRTPMNGVLGMLSLAKQKGLGENQLRLINQAETSGQQMIAMLSDILDYSALQDNRMALEHKPFEPRQLLEAISGLFGAVARREGIRFEVSCTQRCPERIVGDFRRLRQIVAHFASYIVETAGTEDIRIDLDHHAGDLHISISFHHGGLLGRDQKWHPDILLGTRQEREDQFATDALGPAVARGVLEKMGGNIRLDHPDAERIAILLRLPAEPVDIKLMYVLIDTRSAALHTICKVALENENTIVVDATTTYPVHKVLVEAGGHDEFERLGRVKDAFPNALLIALGTPINPGDFDGSIAIPLDITELRHKVLA